MKKRSTICITSAALFTVCLSFPIVSQSQTGTLDPSFDADGIVVTPVGTSSSGAYSVVSQSDGKVVAAGYSNNGTDDDFTVTRYNTDGSLDNTFDNDGIVTTNISTSSSDYVYSIALQSDGKIIVAGYSSNGTDDDIAVARYNTDGSLDNTFDSDGIVTTNISNSSYDHAFSVALQSDGKIVVAGGTSNNGNDDDFAVVRYNTDGSLDSTFDNDGIVTTNISTSSYDYAYSVALQSDGKIVVAGYTNDGTDDDIAVARYNTDGSLDNTFDSDGIVTSNISTGSYDYAYSVALQSDGKIVVAGYSNNNGNNDDFICIRFNTDGSLDNTFDSDGIVTTNISTGSYDYAYSVALQSDGKIVVAGTSNNGNDDDFAVVRYNTDGSLDSSFDNDGIVTTNISTSSYDYAYSVALQSDGKIVVAGYTFDGIDNNIAVVRYDGILDGINTDTPNTSVLNVYPNPFSIQTTLLTENAFDNATLVMYNSAGQQVRAINNINGQTITLMREDLSVGLYFVQIMENNKIMSSTKLIITD